MTAPEPRCPTHGQMHYEIACDWWVCAGYDGEGCDHKVTAEEWQYLGEVEATEWAAPRTPNPYQPTCEAFMRDTDGTSHPVILRPPPEEPESHYDGTVTWHRPGGTEYGWPHDGPAGTGRFA